MTQRVAWVRQRQLILVKLILSRKHSPVFLDRLSGLTAFRMLKLIFSSEFLIAKVNRRVVSADNTVLYVNDYND